MRYSSKGLTSVLVAIGCAVLSIAPLQTPGHGMTQDQPQPILTAQVDAEAAWRTHLGLGYPEPFRGSDWEMATKVDLAARTGVKLLRAHRPTQRDWFAWQEVEPVPGEYDFSTTDRLVRMAQERGMVVLPQVFPYAEWDQRAVPGGGGSAKPHDMDAYTDFLGALVERYDNDGDRDMPGLAYRMTYWEILNEPSLGFFSGPPAEYADILEASYRAVKQACPDCSVLNGGVAGGDRAVSYFERTLQSLQERAYCRSHSLCFDLMSAHSSTDFRTPRALADLLESHGLQREMWITEFYAGWASIEEMGAVFAKSFARGMAIDPVEQLMWFAVAPDCPFSQGYNHHALVNPDGSERSIFTAIQVLAAKLNRFDEVAQLSDTAYRFSQGGERLYLVWDRVPAELGRVRVTRLDGSETVGHAGQIGRLDAPVIAEPVGN